MFYLSLPIFNTKIKVLYSLLSLFLVGIGIQKLQRPQPYRIEHLTPEDLNQTFSPTGLQSNQSLTADDCFHIGRTAYLERDFYHCRLWMNEVLNQQEKGLTYSRFDVLDHFSYCTAQVSKV